jgi:hypothetical protein
MGLKEIGSEDRHRIYLAQNTDLCSDFVNTVMNLRAP